MTLSRGLMVAALAGISVVLPIVAPDGFSPAYLAVVALVFAFVLVEEA